MVAVAATAATAIAAAAAAVLTAAFVAPTSIATRHAVAIFFRLY